jgi:hypothetical protein
LSDHLQRPHIEKQSDPRRFLGEDELTRPLDFPHVGQLDKGDAARYLSDIDRVQERSECSMTKTRHNTSFSLPHPDQYMLGYKPGCSTWATRRMHARHQIKANAFSRHLYCSYHLLHVSYHSTSNTKHSQPSDNQPSRQLYIKSSMNGTKSQPNHTFYT